MFKRLLTLLFVLLLLAGGALWYLRTNLDHIVKRALETYGSAATGTDVEVSGVHIALSTGKGTVSGLKIGNPKSYIAATALKVGDIRMQIDKNSIIGSGPVIIKEINIEKPYVIYEVGANGRNNLQDIQGNVARVPKGKTQSGKMRKVIIRDLYIRQGKVGVTHALLKGKDIKTDLPLIHLRNIGKEGEGATAAEISKQVIGQISTKAAQAGAQALQKELLSADIKKVGDTIKGFFGK